MRRTELESCFVPTVTAERPALGETHPRDDVERDNVNPPPIPLQLAQRPPRTLVVKPPHGTLTHIAGESEEESDEESDHVVARVRPFKNGPARKAQFYGINGMVAASDGSLFVSDFGNNMIRKLHKGVVSTFAGRFGEAGHQDGDSGVAQFSNNRGVTLDKHGRLLVASEHIRAVAPNGHTTTLAHNYVCMAGGGTLPHYAHDALIMIQNDFTYTNHVVAAPDGSIFVSHWLSILKISTDGTQTIIAGDDADPGFVDGSGNVARFDGIQGMAFTASGTLVVCDKLNNRLRRVDPNNGRVATIDLHIPRPYGVSCSSDGTLYVVASFGLYEINRNNEIMLFRLRFELPSLPNNSLKCCHLDEPNGLVYMATRHKIFTISVLSFGERRAARIFPLVRTWALVQLNRANPSTAKAHAVLSRLMRLRVVGVLALVLRFAY